MPVFVDLSWKTVGGQFGVIGLQIVYPTLQWSLAFDCILCAAD